MAALPRPPPPLHRSPTWETWGYGGPAPYVMKRMAGWTGLGVASLGIRRAPSRRIAHPRPSPPLHRSPTWETWGIRWSRTVRDETNGGVDGTRTRDLRRDRLKG